jgi:molecular chaperone DnaK
MDEREISLKDKSGRDIFLDIPLNRQDFDRLIASQVNDTIQSSRETMDKAGLSPGDVARIVFVGGPTIYKPLRDKVAFELGIAPSTDLNPMTAVAEGAAVFAESIDWSSQSRGRKPSRRSLDAISALDLSLNYISRTPATKASVVVKLADGNMTGYEVQIDNLDTAWSSGRSALRNSQSIEVPLSKPNENTFKIFVFDPAGGSVPIANNRFVITRTAASIDAIPASHSLGIEALSKAGGTPVLERLVNAGDQLPKRGQAKFKTETSLRAGSPGSIKFKIWEGEISDPIRDNRFVGLFEIKGSDLDQGAIPAGAEVVCEFELLDSGQLMLEVTVPSIKGLFKSKNYYSRQEGAIDFTKVSKRIEEETNSIFARVDEMSSKIDDPYLDQARAKLQRAASLRSNDSDPEAAGEALQNIEEAKKLLSNARQKNLRTIRQSELDKVIEAFDNAVRQFARPTEITSFENLVKTAQRSIEKQSDDFESHLDDLRSRSFMILWRQDWVVIDRFEWLSGAPHLFPNEKEHRQLVDAGRQALKIDDTDKLRAVVMHMDQARIGSAGEHDVMAAPNIIRA